MIACINDITLDWSILEIASWMYPVWSQTESGAFSFQAARPDPVNLDGGPILKKIQIVQGILKSIIVELMENSNLSKTVSEK